MSPTLSITHQAKKEELLYNAGTKQYKASVQSSGQAASTKMERNVTADGHKDKAARIGKSANVKNKVKPWSSTLKIACKATGCDKEYSRPDTMKHHKIKEHKTGGDSTRKHIGNGAGHGCKRAVSKLPAKSVDASKE